MLFKVISNRFNESENIPDYGTVDFFLEEDNWNDFWYYTLYHLHAGRKLTRQNTEYLGSINIMKKGQLRDARNLLRKELGETFNELPEDYCSISMAVDVYRSLDRYLKRPELKRKFVDALGLILSEEDKRYKMVEDDECFYTSLLRNATMDAFPLKVGREILLDETVRYDLASQPLIYTLPKTELSVYFQFGSRLSDLAREAKVPSRLLACIGNNGVGKSTILYRLARILFAAPAARQHFKDELGLIEPIDAGFRRLFIISYSAFDNFELPGVELSDYELILKGLKDNSGRLVYCGIRDIQTEYETKIEKLQKKEAEKKEAEKKEAEVEIGNNVPGEANRDGDHSSHHRLKTIGDLGTEFAAAFDSIEKDNEKKELWNTLMDECSRANDTFSLYVMEKIRWRERDVEADVEGFKRLSTGIKYVLHSLSVILDRIEHNSIIIFDEPENHIQPPLLSKFLYCLRIVAEEYASLILVATHSPVILQETLARNVLVVSRAGDNWTFRQPSIETYGENIGSITNEVFNLNTSVTNYQKTAEMLFELFPSNESEIDNPIGYLTRLQEESGLTFGNEIQSYLLAKVIGVRL